MQNLFICRSHPRGHEGSAALLHSCLAAAAVRRFGVARKGAETHKEKQSKEPVIMGVLLMRQIPYPVYLSRVQIPAFAGMTMRVSPGSSF